MIVLDFIWNCIKCMLNCFSCCFGHVPEGFTLKEGITGILTFIVLLILIFLLLLLTGVIKFKKDNK